MEAARSDFYIWDEYNVEFLKRRFTIATLADEYNYTGAAWVGGYESFQQRFEYLQQDIREKIRRLDSIRGRIPLLEEASTVQASGQIPRARVLAHGSPDTIFIVHGHTEAGRLAVHGLLREITNLKAVILHDEANRGQTLIEKFESVGSTAGFAVVILTGDDVARVATDADADLLPRGRQNVVFEFGFFVGFLGGSRVAVLYEEGVELPSDIDGLVYIPYDSRGAWKTLLARELKAAGVEIDAEKLL